MFALSAHRVFCKKGGKKKEEASSSGMTIEPIKRGEGKGSRFNLLIRLPRKKGKRE